MEYQFENTGTPDIRAVIEVRYRMNAKRIWIWIGAYLLLGIYFSLAFRLGYSNLFLPVMCFGFAILFALMPYWEVRKGWKKDLAFHNGVLPVNTARFGEKISIENTMASRSWEYYHLVKVCSFQYSYCLRFSDNTVLFFDRGNFTKGTFDEFKQFLREKRPDLKIPE